MTLKNVTKGMPFTLQLGGGKTMTVNRKEEIMDEQIRFPGDSAIDTIGKLHAEIDRLRPENERLEREKAEWERLYEKKQNSYDALVVAYNDLKAALEGGNPNG